MKEIYQLKITLMGIDPPVWRRILVYSDVLLTDLHKIIQTTVGWTNSHLHQFVYDDKFYSFPHEDDIPDENQIDYRKVKLNELLMEINQTMIYEYDFGDGWEHEIKLEKKLPIDSKTKYPECVAGERNRPPEDCGGTGGYEDVLAALKNPNNEEAKMTLEWLGDYDPEYFDLKETNTMLKTDDYGCITNWD
jgi:hypothetical protein